METTLKPIPLVDLQAQYRSIKSDIDAAVAGVIAESAFVGTAGNRFVQAFEAEFARFVGAHACVACANGTDALEILLKAAGIGPGDEVLVPAISWVSTSEAVSACGATPVFVDVLPRLYSMDPALAATKVTPRTRAIIPVHLYGLPARMDEICAIAKRHSLLLLEDCAQAHGALYRGRQVGTFGHAASYSFFPGKNLGAWGDAGAMVTNDEALARTARMLSQHGQAAGRHDHQIEGRNSRMDGLHAAVLSAKLPHLKDWNAARRRIGAHYRVALRDVVSGMQDRPDDAESAYHLFVIEVQHRDRVKAAIAERGISTAIHYPRPLPLLPAYSRLRHRAEDFPEASDIATRILSIPLYPEASDIQQREVIDAVISAVASASAGRNN